MTRRVLFGMVIRRVVDLSVKMSVMMVVTLLVMLLVMLVTAVPANAQRGLSSRGQQGAFVEITNQSFGLDGDLTGGFSFDSQTIGLVYSRRGLYGAVRRGTDTEPLLGQPNELDLFDVTLGVYGELRRLVTTSDERSAIFIPILIASDYRRVRRTEGNAEFVSFEYTSLGVGTGLGIRSSGSTWSLEARATPGIGLATRSFGNSNGRLLFADTDIWMLLRPFSGRLGVSIGYGYRWQSWLVGGIDAFDVAGSGNVTYDGGAHGFRFGISW